LRRLLQRCKFLKAKAKLAAGKAALCAVLLITAGFMSCMKVLINRNSSRSTIVTSVGANNYSTRNK